MPECIEMSDDHRLRYIKIYSLRGKRDRGDLIHTYEFSQGVDDIKHESIFELATHKGTTKQGNKLRQRHCKTDIRKLIFLQGTCS